MDRDALHVGLVLVLAGQTFEEVAKAELLPSAVGLLPGPLQPLETRPLVRANEQALTLLLDSRQAARNLLRGLLLLVREAQIEGQTTDDGGIAAFETRHGFAPGMTATKPGRTRNQR